MKKLDKQIEKILNTYCWADGGCLSKYKSDDKVVSQIKQSILKAIMEKVNKEFFCTHCNNSGKVWDGFLGNWVPCETENDCLFTVVCKFESVIKEVLQTKTNE